MCDYNYTYMSYCEKCGQWHYGYHSCGCGWTYKCNCDKEIKDKLDKIIELLEKLVAENETE